MTIKDYISEKNKSIASLAREANLPYTTVSELVNGKKVLHKCSAGTVYSLAQALGTTVESLLVSEGDGAFPDLFALDRKQSVYVAKRLWDENVYCGMRMENRNVTFPQTKTILEGVNVPGVQLEDITAILNMRDVWRHLLQTVDEKLDLDYICGLNSFIARNEALEWGVLRTGSVAISGTDYKPAISVREKVEKEIRSIVTSYESATNRALSLFCYIAYNQLFWDGNKRTAMTAANKMLLSHGAGMLTIKDRDMEEFNTLLPEMYSTGKTERIKNFLYNNAISGLEMN